MINLNEIKTIANEAMGIAGKCYTTSWTARTSWKAGNLWKGKEGETVINYDSKYYAFEVEPAEKAHFVEWLASNFASVAKMDCEKFQRGIWNEETEGFDLESAKDFFDRNDIAFV